MLPWHLRKKPRGHTRSKKPTSKGEPAGPLGLFPSYPTRIGRGARGHAEAMRLLQMTTEDVRRMMKIEEESLRKWLLKYSYSSASGRLFSVIADCLCLGSITVAARWRL